MALHAGAFLLTIPLSHGEGLAQGIERFGAFSVDRSRPETIRLLDYIDDSAVVDFRRALATFPNLTTILLDSPGGLVNNALVIADIAFERGMSTVVPQQAQCFSSCVYIFMAGRSRLAIGQLGVHQMSADIDLPDARVQETLANIMEALNKFGTPFEIIALMLRTNADDIRVITAQELRDWDVNRDGQGVAANENRPAANPAVAAPPADAGAAPPTDRPATGVALLYEEGPAGVVTPELEARIAWRIVHDPAGPIIAATIEVPERHMFIHMSIQENHNAALAFSHEIDFLVTIDPSYTHPAGGVQSVARLAMKTTEDAVGEPLVGVSQSLPPDFFWIELDPAAENQNLTRLRSREWFDLGIVYANGQRAILTFQKGVDGRAVFEEALQAWATVPTATTTAPEPAPSSPGPTPPAGTVPVSGWYVQLASQTSEAAARVDVAAFRARAPTLLGLLGAVIPTATVNGVTRFRVQFGPMAGHGDAQSLCSSLRAIGVECLIVYNDRSPAPTSPVTVPGPDAPAIALAFEDVGNPTLLAGIANADPIAGERLAAMCAGCHSFGEGEANRFGPNLFDVVYGVVGTRDGFTYSPALAALGAEGAVWTYTGLDAFLASPQAATPGTTMPFRGMTDASERANLIAYLRTLSRAPTPLVFASPAMRPDPQLPAAAYSMTPAASTVTEGESRVLFQLSRSQAVAAETLLVGVRAEGANSGTHDIIAFQRTPLLFPAGQRTRTVQIAILDDDVGEGGETFLVEALQNGILVASARFTIIDDDPGAGDRAAVVAMLRDAVARCWHPPAGWTNHADVRVVLQFRLNRNGTVLGIPQIIERPNSPYAQAAADSAQRAVYACAPYQLPPDLYDGPDGWQEVRMTFDPLDMF